MTNTPPRRPWVELTLARRHAGLTKTALARTARIAKSSLTWLESGQRNPSDRTVLKLAAALGVPPLDLRPERQLPHDTTDLSDLLRALPAEVRPEIQLEPADYQLPDCDQCGTERTGAALVSWAPRDETRAHTVNACRECLPRAVEIAIREQFDGADVLVEYVVTAPATTAKAVAA